MKHGILKIALLTTTLALTGTTVWVAAAEPAVPAPGDSQPRVLTLEECLQQALQNNHRRPASRYAVAIAEAQHRQALAGYWPQISAKGGYQRMDQSPDFLFPATSIHVPAQNLPLPPGLGLAIVDPANNIVGSFSSFPAQEISVPPQDVTLMEEDSFVGSLNLVWLLYDGGMRKGYREQAAAGLDAARQESRRTDLEIADSVRRMYHGAVLARSLHTVGNDTLARMEATLNLTETMYKEGSGKVTKADYLDNKIMVESLRSMVVLLEKNEVMAQAALANTLGLTWTDSVEPAVKEIPFAPYAAKLNEMVSTAYEFNPDWARLEAGLRAADGAERTAKSGHYPKLAFTGELHKWWNDYDAGMATDRNKEGWTVGVGLELPLFEGFLTKHKVEEMRARAAKLKAEKVLLKEGIGLQVKDLFLGLEATRKSYQATRDAMDAAVENRDLNTRAYQNELVETEKVIRAQLVEALMTAQHLKTRYDHVALQSQLNLVVGSEIWKKLSEP